MKQETGLSAALLRKGLNKSSIHAVGASRVCWGGSPPGNRSVYDSGEARFVGVFGTAGLAYDCLRFEVPQLFDVSGYLPSCLHVPARVHLSCTS